MARIRIPGSVDRSPPAPDLGELERHGANAENVQAVQAGARRANEKPTELEGLKADTIVELTFDTGARFYHRFDQLATDMPPAAVRGVAADPETIELPVLLPGSITRGGVATATIEAVRTFDLDLSALGDIAGGLAGKPLAQKFDSWHQANFGLRRWALDTGVLGPDHVSAGDLAGADPLLLFIHGTASR